MKRCYYSLLTALLLFILSTVSAEVIYVANEKASGNPTKYGHILSVTGIGKVFGDGLKLTAVAVEYDQAIASNKLSASSFVLDNGVQITRAYANTEAAISGSGKNGNYVILELDTHEWLPVHEEMPEIKMLERSKNGQRRPPKHDNKPTDLKADMAFRGNPPAHPSIMLSTRHGGNGFDVAVKQVGRITSANGKTLKPVNRWIDNERNISLVLDGFAKPDFHDAKTGSTMKFDIFVPYNYDASKKYPMVVYLHDEYACWNRHDEPLVQGLGPVVWADPAEQAKRECFVLVPIFHRTLQTTDNLKEASLDVAVNLVDTIRSMFNIDSRRVYLVGQSKGASAALALMEKYPQRFTASMCLSGAWKKGFDSLKNEKVLFVCAEDDKESMQGVGNYIDEIEKRGVPVSQTVVDLTQDKEKINKVAKDLVQTSSPVLNLKLKAGSVIPANVDNNDLNAKAYTWRKAYSIESLREWLFNQNK